MPAVAAALALAGGCASGPARAPAPQGPTAQVLRALELGERAQAAQDGDALRAAAGLLNAAGARPAEGAADLAAIWSAEARALGADAPPPRGRTAGPAYREGELGAGGAIAFRDMFNSGRLAIVAVQPRRRGALRLIIAPLNGEPLCALTAVEAAECRWTPIWTEPVVLTLENPTNEAVAYYLVTN